MACCTRTSNSPRAPRRHGVSHSRPQTRSEHCDDIARRTRDRGVSKARWFKARTAPSALDLGGPRAPTSTWSPEARPSPARSRRPGSVRARTGSRDRDRLSRRIGTWPDLQAQLVRLAASRLVATAGLVATSVVTTASAAADASPSAVKTANDLGRTLRTVHPSSSSQYCCNATTPSAPGRTFRR